MNPIKTLSNKFSSAYINWLNMKKIITIFIAGLIVGAIVYGIAYWVFGANANDAFTYAICAFIPGVVLEYWNPFVGKKQKNGSAG